MAAVISAALKLDWNHVISSLGLRGQTLAALQALKKRNEDARRRVQLLSGKSQHVDFAHYRSILKNQDIVEEIEGVVNSFKSAPYNVEKQIKIIEIFEERAVKDAEKTKNSVTLELKKLEETLKNIEEARPFEDLTVDEVTAACPDIEEKASKIISRGRWSVPGYKEKFGDLSIL